MAQKKYVISKVLYLLKLDSRGTKQGSMRLCRRQTGDRGHDCASKWDLRIVSTLLSKGQKLLA